MPRPHHKPARSTASQDDRDLLRRFERAPGHRAGYKQLIREMGLGGGRERRLLLEHLARLTASGKLLKTDREQWSLPSATRSEDKRQSGGPSGIPGENLMAGKLDLHRDGFGFVRPQQRSTAGNDDIFIPPNELNGAMQGDIVLVSLAPARNDGRQHGRIRRILTRSNPTVVGRFHYARGHNAQFGGNYITPMDGRMSDAIVIPHGMERPPTAHTPHRVLGDEAARHEEELFVEAAEGENTERHLEGLIVDVEVTDWPTPTRPAKGRVIEILGHEDDFGVDVEIVIRKHHLPHVFPENVLAEAREVAHLDQEEIARRRDFRDLPIVNIDGETARDFDDAVLVEEHADGASPAYWELQVHIADVAEYVLPDSPLDLEARIRGNSVYFPDRAIPMLPQELSTDICSLRPNEDRLVLSCLMRIDAEGEILDYEVTEGVIRSARRMTYTQVHEIITPGHPNAETTRAAFADFVPRFEQMEKLAHILNKKRDRRGSIDIDLPEPVIKFDELGAMTDVVRSERSWANRLIEEFMLSANECVASWLENLGVPSIYRIHEMPDPRRIIDFEEAAAQFGYSLGLGALPVKQFQFKSERREHLAKKDRHGNQHRGGVPRGVKTHEVPEEIPVTPKMYQRLSRKLAGKPEERILSHLMLRSLKQARYSEKNEGHFALAAPAYTHFTSPIRRYSDLIIHRISKTLLHEGISGHSTLSASPQKRVPHSGEARVGERDAHLSEPLPETELAMISQETSDSERRAAEAERELIEWKKVKFMQDRVGDDFDAIILNATKYGLFVELNDMFIEGLVPLQSLSAADPHHESYTYRENTRQIMSFGRMGPVKKYSAGDRIHVVLERIDAVERRLQFGIFVDLETLNNALKRPGSKKSGPKKSEPKDSSAKKADRKSPKAKQAPPARFAAVAEAGGRKKKMRDKNKGKRRKK